MWTYSMLRICLRRKLEANKSKNHQRMLKPKTNKKRINKIRKEVLRMNRIRKEALRMLSLLVRILSYRVRTINNFLTKLLNRMLKFS